MKNPEPENELTYEQACKRLEEIVQALDEGELTLDQIEKQFEEGMKLASFCSQKLEQVERKVNLLIENAQGEIEREPFDADLDE